MPPQMMHLKSCPLPGAAPFPRAPSFATIELAPGEHNGKKLGVLRVADVLIGELGLVVQLPHLGWRRRLAFGDVRATIFAAAPQDVDR